MVISLKISSPTISLSNNSSLPPFQLITTARIISSAQPASAITLCTDRSVLDNGNHEQHDGLFRGAFLPLQSTTDPKRTIPLAFLGWPNYGSKPDANPNLLERPWTRFETVPPMGQGALVITHDLPLERLFRNSHSLRAVDIRPGERFRFRMNPKQLFWAGWWTFGGLGDDGDLRGKRFAEWECPDEDGDISNLNLSEQMPDVDQMEKEGWLLSRRFDELKCTEDTEMGDVVVEFTK